eukprot:snap_masked-scaffold_22-processed-gene-2.7-mRNA-1 protein AED:1.00 eAED:1.00 QI:0/0/0/0/1/1/2/0/129
MCFNLIIFLDPRKNVFIVPELFPEVKDSKLKISLTTDFVLKKNIPITKEKFLQIVFIFFSHKKPRYSFLYKFFSRIIFGPDELLNILVMKENEFGFRFIDKTRNSFLACLIQHLVEESHDSEHEVEENY